MDLLSIRLQREPVKKLGEFAKPVDLAKVDRHMLRVHGPALGRYRRASRRAEQFEQQLSAFKAGAPPMMYYGSDTRRKKNGFSKDGRGYAWAREELQDELRKARPKLRRDDPLQIKVINSVWNFLVRSACPDYSPHREIDRGVPALIDGLAEAYLVTQFPTRCRGLTADRIRRRPSATRAKSQSV